MWSGGGVWTGALVMKVRDVFGLASLGSACMFLVRIEVCSINIG